MRDLSDETALIIDHSNERAPWWETTLMRDHSNETTLMRDCSMRDHPERRPWWEATFMIDCPDDRQPLWKTILMTEHPDETIRVRDHPCERPRTLMTYHTNEKPPLWKTTLMRDRWEAVLMKNLWRETTLTTDNRNVRPHWWNGKRGGTIPAVVVAVVVAVAVVYVPIGPGQDEGPRADVHDGDELGGTVPVVAADLLQQGHHVVTATHELTKLHPKLHDEPWSGENSHKWKYWKEKCLDKKEKRCLPARNVRKANWLKRKFVTFFAPPGKIFVLKMVNILRTC